MGRRDHDGVRYVLEQSRRRRSGTEMQRALGPHYLAEFDSRFGMTLREGVMSQPLAFNHVDWNNPLSTVDSGGASDPDGGTDGFTLTATADAADTFHYTSDVPQNVRTARATVSLYVKAVTGADWFVIQLQGPVAFCYFDIANGVVGTENGCDGTITDAGNDWYLCEIVADVDTIVTSLDLIMATSDGDNTFVADGSEKVLIYNANFRYTDGGGFAPAWAERSGNGLDLLQATTADQGIFVASGGANGTPFVKFDGLTQFMDVAYTLAQPHTLNIVVVPSLTNDLSGADGYIDGITFLSAALRVNVSTSWLINSPDQVQISNSQAKDEWHIQTAVFDGASSSWSINRATPESVSPGSSAPNGLTIGGYAGGAAFMDCAYARISVARGVLPAWRQARVNAIFARDYLV
jgi:hypothetical protein